MRRRDLIAAFGLAPLALAQRAIAQPAPLLDVLTQADARRGVKDALGLAALNATQKLAQPNAFFANPRLHIPLPGTLAEAQRSLRPLRLSGPLDDLELSLNRAAEAAMPQAARLFSDAVRAMTLADAVAIVRGRDDAATQYLRTSTEPRLTRLLRPAMNTALTESGAFALLREAARAVGMTSAANDLRGQVTDFATAKALDGAFLVIADEERAIRRDPLRRTTDILRRVFADPR